MADLSYLRALAWGLIAALGVGMASCATGPAPLKNAASYYDRPYALGGGDTVRVAVYGEAELSQSYRISQSGHISMPLIGEVQAAGRSASQVRQDISARLANGYLRDPSVTVEVANPRPIFVLGEVGASGQYPYAEGLNGMKAVALAGGYSARAKRETRIPSPIAAPVSTLLSVASAMSAPAAAPPRARCPSSRSARSSSRWGSRSPPLSSPRAWPSCSVSVVTGSARCSPPTTTSTSC